ncbi:hypothetical protein K1719_013454 [Acacia pycnantha]|nr:hypothetical protein K1719_013454 [Acacia pycnantha]
MNCPGTITENELPTAKSSLLNPLSRNYIQSVLTNITNIPSSSNCMQRDDSCLTYSNTLNVTHTVRPESQSVNQKKQGKTHLPQIRELATDLCKSLDIPLHENSRATNDQHDTSTPYGVVDNNLTCTFHSNYLDDGDASLECQFCGSRDVVCRETESHVGGGHLDQSIVEMLKECLDKHNCVVKHYRNAAEIIKQNVISDVSIRLIRSSNVTGQSKQYNMPTTSELAALIVGDFDNLYTKRDIIVKRQSGNLQRIDELHMAYLPLQYPLLFPYGDNGYDSSNEHAQESLSTTKKKKKLTLREYMAFCLMRMKSERSVILHGKKLLQQFIVDGYSMVESDRLDYIRKNQKDLRVDL